MRTDELCDGGEEGESGCPDTPECITDDGLYREIERCDHCPIRDLNESITLTAAGRSVQRALNLDAALQYGLNVPLGSLFAEDWHLLRAIRNERAKRQAEIEKKQKRR